MFELVIFSHNGPGKWLGSGTEREQQNASAPLSGQDELKLFVFLFIVFII